MSDMKLNQQKGLYGERLAQEYLKQRNYTILSSRFRTRYGEADIIAKEGETLVFVEVKTRTSHAFGTPAAAVTANKQKHLTMAALAYLQQTGQMEAFCRFDVVEVDLANGDVHHIANAFEARM